MNTPTGPQTLNAKWLDPECWDGCQSLVWKQKNKELIELMGLMQHGPDEIQMLRAKNQLLRSACQEIVKAYRMTEQEYAGDCLPAIEQCERALKMTEEK